MTPSRWIRWHNEYGFKLIYRADNKPDEIREFEVGEQITWELIDALNRYHVWLKSTNNLKEFE